jgi:heme oxygenase
MPATAEYTARLAALSASQPLLLLAYAQTLYVALLAGGRTLEALLRCARALPVGQGTAISTLRQCCRAESSAASATSSSKPSTRWAQS